MLTTAPFRPGGGADIDRLYSAATGFEPYDFQRRVAEEGLPELLRIPTGCGKTEAVGLGWLYRRRFHAESRSSCRYTSLASRGTADEDSRRTDRRPFRRMA